MIRVSVEVWTGAICFRTGVRAHSIERAVHQAATSYPGGEVRVLFPIDPEAFFIEKSAPALGTVPSEATKEAAR